MTSRVPTALPSSRLRMSLEVRGGTHSDLRTRRLADFRVAVKGPMARWLSPAPALLPPRPVAPRGATPAVSSHTLWGQESQRLKPVFHSGVWAAGCGFGSPVGQPRGPPGRAVESAENPLRTWWPPRVRCVSLGGQWWSASSRWSQTLPANPAPGSPEAASGGRLCLVGTVSRWASHLPTAFPHHLSAVRGPRAHVTQGHGRAGGESCRG